MNAANLRRNVNYRFTIEGSGSRIRYLAEDETTGRFVRLGQREYVIAATADGTRSAQQVAEVAMRALPNERWSGKYIEQCLKWLVHNQILEPVPSSEEPVAKPTKVPNSGRSDSIVEQATAASNTAESNKRAFDVLSFRMPLLSGAAIHRLLTGPSKLLGGPFAIIAVCTFIAAAFCAFQQFTELTQLARKLFVPESKLWWLFAWLVLKTVHETGHAMTAMRIGGAVREAGLTFFCFTPVPFVDVSDVWRSSSRTQRILCTLSGIIAELLLSSIALIVCCFTSSPTIQFACISIVTLGTISTIAFNANPLMRYDGYYVVSDLMNRPTLWNDATNAMKSRINTMLHQGDIQFNGHLGLAIYGFCTFIYRVLMMLGLAWGAITVWEGLGWIAVTLATFSWYIAPTMKARAIKRKLNVQTKLARRKVFAFACGTSALLIVAALVPTPFHRAAPGLITFANSQEIHSGTSGILVEHLVKYGETVKQGQPLARLSNPKLVDEYEQKRIQVAMAQEKSLHLTAESKIAEMQAEQSRVESLSRELRILAKQVESLTITAPCDGVFISNSFDRMTGDFIMEQHVLGIIADPTKLAVEMSVAQQDIDRFKGQSNESNPAVRVRVAGLKSTTGVIQRIAPQATDSLKDPVLAATYNGPIAVRQVKTESGEAKLTAIQNRFEVYVELPPTQARGFQPGQTCSCWPEVENETLFDFGIAWLRRLIDNKFTT